MDDVERLIRLAWTGLHRTLAREPGAFTRRLARRDSATLRRPPRAWCLVVRASDCRIGDGAVTPGYGARADPATGARDPHRVTLDAPLLRKLCAPVYLAKPGEPLRDVARKLGVHPTTLLTSRIRGVFRTHYVPPVGGRGSHPVPLLYTDRPLDPAAPLLAEPDPAWSWTATFLTSRVPPGLRQTLARVPWYVAARRAETPREHDVAPPPRNRRLPPVPADYVWYKWRGDAYLGYDKRNIASGAAVKRAQRRRMLANAAAKCRRQSKGPALSRSTGSLLFRGWRWVCPTCRRHVRLLFFPLPAINLLEDVREPRSTTGFACGRCLRVWYFSRARLAHAWNTLIGFLTGGLLYGREVARPAWLTARRKRPFRPRINVRSPRRDQILRRVLNGWSINQIATELRMHRQQVHAAIRLACRQEGVTDRHALARKLGSPHAPPLTERERAAARRARVMERLTAGRTPREIAAELTIPLATIQGDVYRVYAAHGVHDHRSLLRRLGLTPPATAYELQRKEVRRRRAAGQKWKRIAAEMGLPFHVVERHGKTIAKEQRLILMCPDHVVYRRRPETPLGR